MDCSLENKLLHRFDDEQTIKRFNSPDDLRNHLQETLKDVVSASELLFGGFSDWRNRLEKKNQSFSCQNIEIQLDSYEESVVLSLTLNDFIYSLNSATN